MNRTLRPLAALAMVVREAERDKVAALDAAADDYVTKPFGMDELLARLRAALRRGRPAEEEAVIESDDFTVDLAAKRVSTADGEVRLTPTEWHIVEILVRNASKLVTQRQLLQEVWACSTRRKRTTCASTSPRSAASSNPIRPDPATSSPRPAWATASNSTRSRNGVDGLPPPSRPMQNARPSFCPRRIRIGCHTLRRCW
jgi:hypothetical protein